MESRLEKIEDGDPLEISPRAELMLRADGLFLDPERLALRAMARTALAASTYEGVPGLGDWLSRIIRVSISDLMREQEDEEHHRIDVLDSVDRDFYLRIAQITGVPAKYGRLVCVALNQFPKQDRLSFFAVVLEQKSINRWVAEGHGPPERVKRGLRRIGLRLMEILDRAEGNGGNGGITHGL